jgi:hypothetical protein
MVLTARATELKTHSVAAFRDMDLEKTLITHPDIQRRPVWKSNSKMLLIDSLARGVPIGAITLYEDPQPEGYNIYEVIDGKQRLTTILDYLSDAFALDEQQVESADEDDIADVGRERAETLYGKLFTDLTRADTQKLLQYEIPVFIVRGTRDQAVQAFTRMNRHSYVLKPQEIRNAVYSTSKYLAASVQVTEGFSVGVGGEDSTNGFVALGVISESSLTRMQDIQYSSELLALVLDGEQNRRDSLNGYYDNFREPGRAQNRALSQAVTQLSKTLNQISEIFNDGAPLAGFHYPSPCEDDFYALVGALAKRGPFSRPQMDSLGEDIRDGLSEFRRQVGLYVSWVQGRIELEEKEIPELAIKYGQTLLGGQRNSMARRVTRREIIVEILDGLAPAPVTEHFSPAVRELIWGRTEDKTCARCGEVVDYSDYHAGHKVPKARGGTPTLSNGQIEHKECNLNAGAD